MNENPDSAPEFSRPLAADSLGETAALKQITASGEERAALARRFGLLALDHLSADLRIRRLPGNGAIHAAGRFTAEATQACVISLEPVHARLSEEFSQFFTLAAEVPDQGEHVIDVEAEDPPETLGPEGLDLGEAVVQQFVLALDPYPRAPGAQPPLEPDEASRIATGPFAALKALKGGG